MARKVRILVVGGRFMPHRIGIAADPPEIVAFIASPDTKGQTETALASLKTLPNLKVVEPIEFVDSYDLREARVKCEQVTLKFPNADITFDVTSAPKVPSFAALKVAQEQNHRVIVVDSSNGKVISIEPENAAIEFNIRLDLDQYLECFGRRAVGKFNLKNLSVTEEQAVEMARFLTRGDSIIEEALSWLRQWSQGKGKRTIGFDKTKPILDGHFEIFKKIETQGLISHVQRNEANRISYQIANDFDFKFLDGAWLEFFVFDAARSLCNDSGSAFFDDVRMNVEIPSNEEKKEIDVACLSRGRLLQFSCKTSNPFRTVHLDELRAVSDLVGGDFATRFFVTNVLSPAMEKNDERKNFEEFQAHARARKIVIVAGDQLRNIGDIVKKEAHHPTFRRI